MPHHDHGPAGSDQVGAIPGAQKASSCAGGVRPGWTGTRPARADGGISSPIPARTRSRHPPASRSRRASHRTRRSAPSAPALLAGTAGDRKPRDVVPVRRRVAPALPVLEAHILYVSRKYLPLKLRTFIDFFVEYVSKMPLLKPIEPG